MSLVVPTSEKLLHVTKIRPLCVLLVPLSTTMLLRSSTAGPPGFVQFTPLSTDLYTFALAGERSRARPYTVPSAAYATPGSQQLPRLGNRSMAVHVRPPSAVRYAPTPPAMLSLETPTANRWLVGLMSIWNSFWLPLKAGFDMRMLAGAVGTRRLPLAWL